MTLEELLRTKVAGKNKDDRDILFTPDFMVSVQREGEDGVHFIIHPFGYSGDTLDFICKENILIEV